LAIYQLDNISLLTNIRPENDQSLVQLANGSEVVNQMANCLVHSRKQPYLISDGKM
jgi:hypothetical protein